MKIPLTLAAILLSTPSLAAPLRSSDVNHVAIDKRVALPAPVGGSGRPSGNSGTRGRTGGSRGSANSRGRGTGRGNQGTEGGGDPSGDDPSGDGPSGDDPSSETPSGGAPSRGNPASSRPARGGGRGKFNHDPDNESHGLGNSLEERSGDKVSKQRQRAADKFAEENKQAEGSLKVKTGKLSEFGEHDSGVAEADDSIRLRYGDDVSDHASSAAYNEAVTGRSDGKPRLFVPVDKATATTQRKKQQARTATIKGGIREEKPLASMEEIQDIDSDPNEEESVWVDRVEQRQSTQVVGNPRSSGWENDASRLANKKSRDTTKPIEVEDVRTDKSEQAVPIVGKSGIAGFKDPDYSIRGTTQQAIPAKRPHVSSSGDSSGDSNGDSSGDGGPADNDDQPGNGGQRMIRRSSSLDPSKITEAGEQWKTTLGTATDTIWPILVELVSNYNNAWGYSVAWAIYQQVDPYVIASGPFYNGMHCFDDIEKEDEAAGLSEDQKNDLLALDQNLIDIYTKYYQEAQAALEKSGVMDTLDTLSAMIADADPATLPADLQTQSTLTEEDKLFADGMVKSKLEFSTEETKAAMKLGGASAPGATDPTTDTSSGDQGNTAGATPGGLDGAVSRVATGQSSAGAQGHQSGVANGHHAHKSIDDNINNEDEQPSANSPETQIGTTARPGAHTGDNNGDGQPASSTPQTQSGDANGHRAQNNSNNGDGTENGDNDGAPSEDANGGS